MTEEEENRLSYLESDSRVSGQDPGEDLDEKLEQNPDDSQLERQSYKPSHHLAQQRQSLALKTSRDIHRLIILVLGRERGSLQRLGFFVFSSTVSDVRSI